MFSLHKEALTNSWRNSSNKVKHPIMPRLLSEINYTLFKQWYKGYAANKDEENVLPEVPAFIPREEMRQVLQEGLSGPPGFCWLAVPESAHLNDDELRAFYLLAGLILGEPNNRYGYLYDIRDRGSDYTKEAIPVSHTKADTGFHTDSTSAEYFPDVIGLLCIRPAYQGGVNLISNAADCWLELEKNATTDHDFLQRPLIRDVITPGSDTSLEALLANRFPIFSQGKFGLRFRYMRYWIERGAEKAGQRLTDRELRTLDLLDEALQASAHCLEIKLERGQMLFVNNHFLAHSRTEFYDPEATENKRLFVRMWLDIDKPFEHVKETSSNLTAAF